MKHTIDKLKNKIEFVENGKTISTNGYAFTDESGCCIIITYCEGRKDAMSKYLTEDGNVLKIKYEIIPL